MRKIEAGEARERGRGVVFRLSFCCLSVVFLLVLFLSSFLPFLAPSFSCLKHSYLLPPIRCLVIAILVVLPLFPLLLLRLLSLRLLSLPESTERALLPLAATKQSQALRRLLRRLRRAEGRVRLLWRKRLLPRLLRLLLQRQRRHLLPKALPTPLLSQATEALPTPGPATEAPPP